MFVIGFIVLQRWHESVNSVLKLKENKHPASCCEDEPEEERREIVERVDDDSYDNQQAACVLISLQRRAIEVVVSYNDNLKDCDNQDNPKNAAEVFIEHFRVLLVIGFE